MNEREALRAEWEKLCGAAQLLAVARDLWEPRPAGTFEEEAELAVVRAEALIAAVKERCEVADPLGP